MELIGKVIAALPLRSGISQRTGAEWQLASYVLETQGDRFARRMVFEVFGADRIQQFNVQVGETLRVSFDIDARESSEGRWFNSIRAWAVDRNLTEMPGVSQAAYGPIGQPAPPVQQPVQQQAAPSAAPFAQSNENDSLPF